MLLLVQAIVQDDAGIGPCNHPPVKVEVKSFGFIPFMGSFISEKGLNQESYYNHKEGLDAGFTVFLSLFAILLGFALTLTIGHLSKSTRTNFLMVIGVISLIGIVFSVSDEVNIHTLIPFQFSEKSILFGSQFSLWILEASLLFMYLSKKYQIHFSD